MKLLSRGSFQNDRDWQVYNKIAQRILPFLFVLFVIAFLDRVNVGFAKLQMAADIGLSDMAFGFGAGVFFLGYSLCEIPSNVMLQRVGARFWIARIMFVWGLLSAGMMFVNTPTAFYIMRFVLGVAEAGFYPGVVLYMTYWLPQSARSQGMAYFTLGIPMAGVIGSPLSGWIMQTFSGYCGMAGWQWLFLIEGVPATLMGIVAYLYLDNGPGEAKWLTEEENQRVVSQIEAERRKNEHNGASHQFRAAFVDKGIWCLIVTNFTLLCGTYGVSFWMPQIVKNLGVQSLFHTGLIAAIPFVFASVAMIVISKHSDRTQERRWHSTLSCIASAAGLIISALFHDNAYLSLLGLSIAMSGGMCAFCVLWALPGVLLTGTAAAAGIALIATVGNLGGYASPFMMGWVQESTGHLEYGLYVLALMTLLGAVSMLAIPQLRKDNSAYRVPVTQNI